MSRGTAALVGALFFVSALIVLAVAVLIVATSAAPDADSENPPSVLTLVWRAAMHAMDAGALGGDDAGHLYLFLMLVVTVAGIFLVSALIGILNSGLEGKLSELRKGKSRVIEQGHVLILGWSAQIPTIVSELLQAAASTGGGTVVIVAERDKVEMDDELSVKVRERHGGRVVCRSGSPIDLDDLELGSPEAARSIVVLRPEGTEDADAAVIKTILALTAHKPRAKGKHHIVAEIEDPKNRAPALMVGKGQVQLVVASEVIAKIAVQTCRQSGLSAIYNDLLDFGGDELYFYEAPSLAKKTFGDALQSFEESSLIGLLGSDGVTRLNPPMDTVLEAGCKLVLVAEDDSSIRVRGSEGSKVEADAIASAKPKPQTPERTLILGWNQRGPLIVDELDKYALPGSKLTIVSRDERPREVLAGAASLKNHEVTTVVGDIADRRLLDGLELSSFHHVVTLAYSDDLGVQRADAITLVTLLHLRDIEDKVGESFSIVSEMLDTKNRRLAEVTKADDFIVSELLVSLLICQLAENGDLGPVFDDLFDADGAEIYLKPAEEYVALDRSVSYATVVEAARRRGQTAIGFTKGAEGAKGTRLNPKKSTQASFQRGDRIVVLSDA